MIYGGPGRCVAADKSEYELDEDWDPKQTGDESVDYCHGEEHC